MTARGASRALAAVLVVTFLVGLALLSAPVAGASPAPLIRSAASHGAASAPAPASAPPAPRSTAAPATPRTSLPAAPSAPPVRTPSVSNWTSYNFFQDVQVQFYGTGLSTPFLAVPNRNVLPFSDYGFWVNVTSNAPMLFANLTIWGNLWPGLNTSNPISSFSPTNPTLAPMIINPATPARASFYFDNYRFFWPGSVVSFNITIVGKNTTPSIIKSAWNESVPQQFPGGYTNMATWTFAVGTPWASSNFTDDIAVSTNPNVIGANVFAPNPNQRLAIGIAAIDLGGTVSPIPDAILKFVVIANGTAIDYSEPFGPSNHTMMTANPIGPYGDSTVKFNVTAWVPWEGGEIDTIVSPTYSVTWSANGGWWHPNSGLTGNLNLVLDPSISVQSGTVGSTVPVLPTDAPLNISIHEPIENVTISSAQIDFTFTDSGNSHSGYLPMTAINANTSFAILPGLPPGAALRFYVVAKDIDGVPVASGNYSYSENGPSSPALPSGRGLLFVEALDLTGGGLLTGFSYTLSNATWTETLSANRLGFGTPLLPGSYAPYQLAFGLYTLTVHAFGTNQSVAVALSPDNPTPTVVFFGETSPAPITTTGSIPVESIVAMLGLIAAAVVTLPLVRWYEERRSQQEAEQRRITL